MRLIYKTTFILLSMVVVTVTLVGVTNFFLTKFLLQSSISDNQLNDIEHIMYNIDMTLYERLLDIQSIGGTVPFINYLTINTNKLESYSRLTQYKNLTGPWLDLLLLDKNKNIVMRSFEPFDQKNIDVVDDEPELEKAFTAAYRGELYYSDLLISSKYKKPVIIFAAPIRNYNQFGSQIVGVVIGQLLWEAILENIALVQSDAYHFNREIVLLYNKNGFLLGGSLVEHNKDILIDDHSRDEIFKTALTSVKNGSVIALGAHDKEKLSLMTFTKEKGYLNYRGNNWILISELPTTIAFASAISSAWSVVLILLVLLIILILVFGFFINKIIINPLDKITQQANQIAGGNFNSKIEITGKDELGQLGSSFNIMTGRLRESYRNLEHKVETRTEELSEKLIVIQQQNKRLSKTDNELLNLTNRLSQEKKVLSEEKLKLETLINTLPLSVLMVGFPDGNLLLQNLQAKEMFGKYIISGKFDLMACGFLKENEELYPINELPLSIVFAKEELSIKNDIFLIAKNGKKIALRMIVAPIKNQIGQLLLALVIIEDITVEYEIDRVKSEFVSFASHQLRTPLSSINWYTEILLSGAAGKITAQQKKFLKEIDNGGQRMTDLINSLLNVSRLELGVFVVDSKPTNIIDIIKSVFKELIPQIKTKKLVINKDFTKQNIMLDVDTDLLRIIFQNLLSNAVKYTPDKGSINLFIQKKFDQILISVTDTGYGIPLNQQAKIFTKLFRADNVREKDPSGTGLGLYIVKLILDNVGGKVWFESKEGEGTTFYFSLPLEGMKQKVGNKSLIT